MQSNSMNQQPLLIQSATANVKVATSAKDANFGPD